MGKRSIAMKSYRDRMIPFWDIGPRHIIIQSRDAGRRKSRYRPQIRASLILPCIITHSAELPFLLKPEVEVMKRNDSVADRADPSKPLSPTT